MNRLLLTGARGFIGRHCLEPALAAGFEVHATTSANRLPEGLEPQPVAWHRLDLLAPGAVESLVEEVRPTHVLHCAWETTHGAYWTSPANLHWLALGARLVDAFRAVGGRRFVAAGSCAEYEWREGNLVEGETPDRPATFYGRIKLAHHHMLMAAAAQFGFSAATGRIFFVYGPHEGAGRLVPHACRELGAGRAAEFSSGRQERDFLHVADAAMGLVALLGSDLAGICNIASGTAVPLRTVVEKIAARAGHPYLPRFGAIPERPGDPPVLAGSSERLRSLGWAPRVTLEEGLDATFDWWQYRASA